MTPNLSLLYQQLNGTHNTSHHTREQLKSLIQKREKQQF